MRNRNVEGKQFSEVMVLQVAEFWGGSPEGGAGVQAFFRPRTVML
jgi:hypothetical protein